MTEHHTIGVIPMSCRAAHDAARVLYDNHRALGLDVLAVKLDTLRWEDVAV